jgi:hypothetical protein
MTLEIVRGESKDRALAERLADAIRRSTATGTVYLGYPVLSSADDRVEIDALLVSRNHGLVAFQLADEPPRTEEQWKAAQDSQDRLYNALDSHLVGLCQVGARACPRWRSQRGAGRLQRGQAPAQQPSRA